MYQAICAHVIKKIGSISPYLKSLVSGRKADFHTKIALRHQAGTSLFDAVMALGIGGVAMAAGANALMDGYDDLRDQAAAEHFQAVVNATDRYISNQYENLANGGNVTISMSDLQPYLPPGFDGENPYEQNYQIVISPTGSDGLQVAIVTQGGRDIPEVRRAAVAARIGANGGFTDRDNHAQGAYGGWAVELSSMGASTTAGRLASVRAYDEGEIIPDFVHRQAVPGRPDLATMQTHLDMNNHNIDHIAQLQANTVNIQGQDISGDSVTARSLIVTQNARFSHIDLEENLHFGGNYNSNSGRVSGGTQMDYEDAVLINELADLNCQAGDLLTRRNGQFLCSGGGLTSDMVLATRGNSCPEGWTRFTEADGRMIAGVDPSDGRFDLGDTGGQAEILIQHEHLPRGVWIGRAPYNTLTGNDFILDGVARPDTSKRVDMTNHEITDDWEYLHSRQFAEPVAYAQDFWEQSGNTLSQRPLETLPPYVALIYCKKD